MSVVIHIVSHSGLGMRVVIHRVCTSWYEAKKQEKKGKRNVIPLNYVDLQLKYVLYFLECP